MWPQSLLHGKPSCALPTRSSVCTHRPVPCAHAPGEQRGGRELESRQLHNPLGGYRQCRCTTLVSTGAPKTGTWAGTLQKHPRTELPKARSLNTAWGWGGERTGGACRLLLGEHPPHLSARGGSPARRSAVASLSRPRVLAALPAGPASGCSESLLGRGKAAPDSRRAVLQPVPRTLLLESPPVWGLGTLSPVCSPPLATGPDAGTGGARQGAPAAGVAGTTCAQER